MTDPIILHTSRHPKQRLRSWWAQMRTIREWWPLRHRRGLWVMPDRFHELAAYNSDVSRGLPFDTETVERMRDLQADYDAWMVGCIYADAARRGQTVKPMPGGGFLVFPPDFEVRP